MAARLDAAKRDEYWSAVTAAWYEHGKDDPLLTMLAFKVGNLTTADVVDGYRIKANFDNVGGLKIKAAVTVAGVRVGRVTNIAFDSNKYQALVTMNIDGRYMNIPKDSSATILTSGLLGERVADRA